jgi:hypothetical protein
VAPAWFQFTAPEDGLLVVTSCSGEYPVDTHVFIHESCDTGAILSNDFSGTSCPAFGHASTVAFEVELGESFLIYWAPTFDGESPFEMTLTIE